MLIEGVAGSDIEIVGAPGRTMVGTDGVDSGNLMVGTDGAEFGKLMLGAGLSGASFISIEGASGR
jgi:hypothetical protein